MYPQSMFYAKIRKMTTIFYRFFKCLQLKNLCILHGRAFVTNKSLLLYCYERDFMDSLNHDNQADVIEAFNSTSTYLDDLLNIKTLILKVRSIKFIHLNYS